MRLHNIIAAVVIVGVLGYAVFYNRGSDDTPAPSPAAVATDRPSATSPPAAGVAATSAAPSVAPPGGGEAPLTEVEQDPMIAVARTAVTAWQAGDVATLATVTTPAYQEAASTIDYALVPQAPIVSAVVIGNAEQDALVSVALDDGTYLTVIVRDTPPQGWLAADILPAD